MTSKNKKQRQQHPQIRAKSSAQLGTALANFSDRWAWPILLGAFGLFFLRFFLQFNDIDQMSNMDLPSFYSASIQVFQNGVSPYNFSEFSKVLEGQVTRTYPYLYPPPSLLIFYPLSFLTYAQAKAAFFVLNTILVVVLAWLLPLRLCGLEPRRNVWMIVLCFAVIVLFGPLAQTVRNGQINLIVLWCLLLFWDRARTGHQVSSAFFLTIGILLKTYPVVLLPMLILLGRYRLALLTVAFCSLATVGSALLLPDGLWDDWLFKVAPSGSYTQEPEGLFAPSTIGNQSLNGFFSRLFTEGEWAQPIMIAPLLGANLTTSSAGLLVALSILVVFLARKDTNALDKAMIISLSCIYLIAPFSWFHHLVYLLPALLMLLCATWRGGTVGGVIFLALVLAITIIMSSFRMLDSEMSAALGLWCLTVYSVLSKNVELPGALRPKP